MDSEVYNLLVSYNYTSDGEVESDESIAKLENYFISQKSALPKDLQDIYCEVGAGEGIGREQRFVIFNISHIFAIRARCDKMSLWDKFIAFGSNGGGEYWAFDLTTECLHIAKIPQIGFSSKTEALFHSNDFRDFLVNGVNEGLISKKC